MKVGNIVKKRNAMNMEILMFSIFLFCKFYLFSCVWLLPCMYVPAWLFPRRPEDGVHSQGTRATMSCHMAAKNQTQVV